MKRFCMFVVMVVSFSAVGWIQADRAMAKEPSTCEEKAAAGSLEFCEVEKLKLELYRTKIGALADKQNDLQRQINELSAQYKSALDGAARLRGITADHLTEYKLSEDRFEKLPTPSPTPSPAPAQGKAGTPTPTPSPSPSPSPEPAKDGNPAKN